MASKGFEGFGVVVFKVYGPVLFEKILTNTTLAVQARLRKFHGLHVSRAS